MNNLLFTALIIALLYYFFYYLPSQKKLNANNLPLPQHQSTQTETIIRHEEPGVIQFPSAQAVPDSEIIKELYEEKQSLLKDISQKEKTITGLNNSYDKLEKSKNQQIKELQAQIRDLTKRPLKPTNSKGTQTEDKSLENTLDTLIKDIQTLNNEL